MQPLYLDDTLLVLDKPAGLLSVPGRGADKQDCLSTRAQQLWPDARVVHRLDMATSGLMLMARSPAVQRALGDAFAQRRVHKRYVAVVAGRVAPPPQDWGVIDLPLLLDWPRRPLSKVDWEHGKPSLTRWRVLSNEDRWPGGATRLELEPLTGRSHQLRVHLRALGHPILGDALYGDAVTACATPRLLLHACALAFTHPASGVDLRFDSPAPF